MPSLILNWGNVNIYRDYFDNYRFTRCFPEMQLFVIHEGAEQLRKQKIIPTGRFCYEIYGDCACGWFRQTYEQ